MTMSGSDPRRPGQGAGASSQPKPNIWCISRERRGPVSISRSTAYGRGVSTVAPPASIEVEDREVRGQKFGERSVRASINRCAAYESHRWTLTKPIECDRCVICRNDGVHPYVSLLSRSEPASGFLTGVGGTTEQNPAAGRDWEASLLVSSWQPADHAPADAASRPQPHPS
jgi:hypothetical protein